MSEKVINGVPCSVQENKNFNQIKGVLYVKDLGTNKEESFKDGLYIISRYSIKEVLQAHWIKQRDRNSKSF